jgi:hypothetical protein
LFGVKFRPRLKRYPLAMVGFLQNTPVLRQLAAGLLVVLLSGPTLSVASTCADAAPPTVSSDHGDHGSAAASHDACCAEEGAAPDCSGATPCASPCGVLPAALVLDAAVSEGARPETARQPGSLSVPPPRPPPIR